MRCRIHPLVEGRWLGGDLLLRAKLSELLGNSHLRDIPPKNQNFNDFNRYFGEYSGKLGASIGHIDFR